MKTMQNLVASVLTATLAQPTKNESVNTTAWAKWFDFSLQGDPNTSRQLSGMVDAGARFIKELKAKSSPRWLTFLGTCGAGKTYIARKIWKWYKNSEFFTAGIDRDRDLIIYPGAWVSWPNMASELLSNRGYAVLEDLQHERLIVLDEIGADRDPNGHVRDCLGRLLSARVGKWTILTSNKSLGDIQRDIDTRISSRMIRDGNVVIDVDLPDFALRQ